MQKVKIQFSSRVLGLFDVKELRPQPAKKFIPEEWKKIPSKHTNEEDSPYKYNLLRLDATAKSCPSFIHLWEEGYVLVAPCDISIRENVWETALPEVQLSTHPNYQYIDHVDSDFSVVHKIDNVWLCKTPKGYSIRQIPLLWHSDLNFEVAYGIIHTDQWHEINPQIMIKKGVKEVFIKQGDPLCYILPYKRIDTELEVVDFNEKEYATSVIKNMGKFKNPYLKRFNILNPR
jgi:hypothetical protein|tara:strand:- start:72 stop:767 length:696 start_codon:yes stop_codon:yes gene_type:complete